MTLLLDMNLSPRLATLLSDAGLVAIHWREVGPGDAPDEALLQWALENEAILVTTDKKVSNRLARSQAVGPSLILIRDENLTPDVVAPTILDIISRFERELRKGAVISSFRGLDRVSTLPLG